jgi:bifunctional DNA-binding transcriptional regulator/antitoxin component of YhaV-PrlF toxin-antitoxin module
MGADGKLVVPEDARSTFKLKPGDIIDFYLDETARTARIRVRNLDFSEIKKMFPVRRSKIWTTRSASISRKTTSG